MRNSLLVIHILAAATWIGANVTQAVVSRFMVKRGGMAAANWYRATVHMGTRLYTPAAVIILLTGVWLVIDSPVYEFEHAFVIIGIAMVVIGGALGGAFFGPQGERVADLHEKGDSGVAAAGNRLAAVGVLDTLLLVVTVAAMVGRWGV